MRRAAMALLLFRRFFFGGAGVSSPAALRRRGPCLWCPTIARRGVVCAWRAWLWIIDHRSATKLDVTFEDMHLLTWRASPTHGPRRRRTCCSQTARGTASGCAKAALEAAFLPRGDGRGAVGHTEARGDDGAGRQRGAAKGSTRRHTL